MSSTLQPQAYAQTSHQFHRTAGQPAAQGTLAPGQRVRVNKRSVQIERYLTQGGYAHVYVVTTDEAINGTNRHVLKRLAVPDEAALKEVQKEVDIMRILKGHPTIVYLIDAAWSKLSDGTYEVFILMEFCAGGGIIDMMNRRLRERLTESEILQIFVDVCEAVAAMHHLQPAILHRDLKVENILQSSSNSFKLCDFGSASTVTKPPTNTFEIRAVEADLNKHTTLQYRAPEMVDVYQRRRIDEKSDIWALGVLLYKLCFYTTPFEEHGPLAILNVQYKIPSYPVYSRHMITLISSMLQEYGAQRPTVFDLLDTVHKLRGSHSLFNYAKKAPSPLYPLDRKHASPVLPSTMASLDGLGVLNISQIALRDPSNRVLVASAIDDGRMKTATPSVDTLRPGTSNLPQSRLALQTPSQPASTQLQSQASTSSQSLKDSRSGFTDSFGESFGARKPGSLAKFMPSSTLLKSQNPTPPLRDKTSKTSAGDAFHGLDGLQVPKSSTGSSSRSLNSYLNSGEYPDRTTPKATPSPRPSPSPRTQAGLPLSSTRRQLQQAEPLSVEERFPPIENLVPAKEAWNDLHHKDSSALNDSLRPRTRQSSDGAPIPAAVYGDRRPSTNRQDTGYLNKPPSLQASRPLLQRKHRSSTGIQISSESKEKDTSQNSLFLSLHDRSGDTAKQISPQSSAVKQVSVRDDTSSDEGGPENPDRNILREDPARQQSILARTRRQSSVHELVDHYGGRTGPSRRTPSRKTSPVIGNRTTIALRTETIASITGPDMKWHRARPQSLILPSPAISTAPPIDTTPEGADWISRRKSVSADKQGKNGSASRESKPSHATSAQITFSPTSTTASGANKDSNEALGYKNISRDFGFKATPPDFIRSPTSEVISPTTPPHKSTFPGYQATAPSKPDPSTRASVSQSDHRINQTSVIVTPSVSSEAAMVGSSANQGEKKRVPQPRSLLSLLQADSDHSTNSSQPPPPPSPDKPFRGVGKLIQQWQSIANGGAE